MAEHAAFVPAEPWVFHSPDVARVGRKVDMGLVAEALIFYDRVYVGITSDEQYLKLVSWFKAQGRTDDLIALIREGALVVYYYAFTTNAGNIRDTWDVLNLQDEEQGARPVFAERIAGTGRMPFLIGRRSLREELERAVLDNHIEVKAEDFGATLLGARADYGDVDRCKVLVQLMYDELFKEMGFLKPPTVSATVEAPRPGVLTFHWNRNFGEFRQKLGPKLTVHAGTPLAAAAFGVKTLWSAAQLECDLYVGAPLTHYLALKLNDGSAVAREKAIIEELTARAEFPNVRALVNRGTLGANSMLSLRSKGARFRKWLESEATVERDVLAAYLSELADDAGWKKNLGKVIRAAGVLGGAAAGGALAGPLGAAGGAFAGEGIGYVADLAARLDAGWRPRVFGQAVQAEVDRATDGD